MTRRCDRCGAKVVDAVGSTQCSLFDVVPADPRATDAARAELRSGRTLCPACQRTAELFPTETTTTTTTTTTETTTVDAYPRTLNVDESREVDAMLWPFHGRVDGPQTLCRVCYVATIRDPESVEYRNAVNAAHIFCSRNGIVLLDPNRNPLDLIDDDVDDLPGVDHADHAATVDAVGDLDE